MSLLRHARAFGAAWRAEDARKRQGRKSWVETEFLPAALEVTETPPSPIGRAILWLIVAATVVALLWACLSTVDEVAVAEGRLVSAGRLRSVEAAEAGVIRAIQVREGQRVNAGDPLIELDPTVAQAGAESARSELSTAALTRARATALLNYAAGRGAAVPSVPGADAAALAAERQVVDARIREYEARRASALQRQAGALATVQQAEAEIGRAAQLLPLAQAQLDARRRLEMQGLAPRLNVLQAEERVVGLRQDQAAQQARRAEAQAQAAGIAREQAQLTEEFRSRAAQELSEAEATSATRTETLRVAEQRQGRQRLTAPVSGVVQELSVATLGQVVDTGRQLVTIVPANEALVVEALLLNRDAGFVHAGDRVVVKLEAYPFTRYGTLVGVVQNVAPDAIVDERRGLVFPARVRIQHNNLRVAGRAPALSPGMTATIEIVTGSRRVIEYLWSPVARAVREAARER